MKKEAANPSGAPCCTKYMEWKTLKSLFILKIR